MKNNSSSFTYRVKVKVYVIIFVNPLIINGNFFCISQFTKKLNELDREVLINNCCYFIFNNNNYYTLDEKYIFTCCMFKNMNCFSLYFFKLQCKRIIFIKANKFQVSFSINEQQTH